MSHKFSKTFRAVKIQSCLRISVWNSIVNFHGNAKLILKGFGEILGDFRRNSGGILVNFWTNFWNSAGIPGELRWNSGRIPEKFRNNFRGNLKDSFRVNPRLSIVEFPGKFGEEFRVN